MKLVHAFWEKRNIGVETIEITLEQKDKSDEIKDILRSTKAEYLVVRVPSTRPEFIWMVQEYGYRYVEDMIRLVHNLKEQQYSSIMQRMRDAVTYELIEENDFEYIEKEVSRGLFNTDRVYLDPYFSKELAARRYVMWLKDEKERGVPIYKYIYKQKMVGFFTLREIEPQIYISSFGAMLKDKANSGIGTVVKGPELVKKLGGKKIISDVSTNNIIQIKALTNNGYVPESINHIFVKHN